MARGMLGRSRCGLHTTASLLGSKGSGGMKHNAPWQAQHGCCKHQEVSPGSQAAPHNLSLFLCKAGKVPSRFCTAHVKISSGFTMLLTIREVENTGTPELLISNAGEKTSKLGLSMNEPVNSCPQVCRFYHCPSCSY